MITGANRGIGFCWLLLQDFLPKLLTEEKFIRMKRDGFLAPEFGFLEFYCDFEDLHLESTEKDENMKTSFSGMILALWVLTFTLAACNFPGVGSPTQTSQPTVTPETSSLSDRPIQETNLPATSQPDLPTHQVPESEPLITAKGPLDCLVNPIEGSEVMTVFSAGDTAFIIGKTPNEKWIAVKEPDKPKPCWVLAMAVELNVNLGALEVLSPPVASTPSPGSIGGILWHEICQFSGGQAGEPLVLGQGCVQWGAEEHQFGPNQVYDPFEEGWEGVTLHLGVGPCPSTGLDTAVTNADGEYLFAGLSAGTYCVSYSALTDGNDSILIPGGPTYPERGENGYYQTVTLAEGENALGIDFGYAWQFFN